MDYRTELIEEVLTLIELPDEERPDARKVYGMCSDDELRDYRDRLRSEHVAGIFKAPERVTMQDALRRQAMLGFLAAMPAGRA